SYDELFNRRADAIPIHLAFDRTENLSETARDCFQTSLQQYIAYRRVDPNLLKASLTFNDLSELAAPSDYELISKLLEDFDRERANADERAFLRFCLSAFQRLNGISRRIFPLVDCTQIAGQTENDRTLGREIAGVFADASTAF